MARGIARNLKPGGRFVTYFLDPDFSRVPGYYRKYSFEVFADENIRDGEILYFSLILGDTVTPRLSNYYWGREAVASAFEEAGFTAGRWILSEVSEQGIARHGREYWEDYLRQPHGIWFECRKA